MNHKYQIVIYDSVNIYLWMKLEKIIIFKKVLKIF